MIINTRKLEYDASSSESAVKGLMQAQHKSSLKSLKRGEFDEKIDRYFGDNPDLQPAQRPRAQTPPPDFIATDVEAEATRPKSDTGSESDVSAAFEAITEETAPTPHLVPEESTVPTSVSFPMAAASVPDPGRDADTTKMEPLPMPGAARPGLQPEAVPRAVHAMPTAPVERVRHRSPFEATAADPGVYRQVRTGNSERMSVPAPTAAQPPLPVARARVTFSKPSGKKAKIRDRMGETSAPRSRGGVVVSRPAVIVGGGARVVSGGAGRGAPRRFAREDSSDGLFGDDMLSEKSLDEVILAYLSEDGD